MASSTDTDIEANPLFGPLVSQLRALTRASVGPEASFEAVEAAALQVGNLAIRAVVKQKLQAVSDSLGEKLRVGGTLYHRHLGGEVTYHSLCGPLEVRRFTYRKCGERNGPTVVPLELACGLVERATPALGYSVTLGYAQGELRSFEEAMEAAHRRLPSRSTLERMAKAIGTEARRKAPAIEACLREEERLPQGARGMSMGLDRVAVPMEEDRAEGAPPKTRRKQRTQPYQRSKPKPVDVNYRMAYVGTFSLVDAQGEELVTRRYTALPEQQPDDVVDRLMEDVKNGLRQDGTLQLGVVQDGAPEMWNAMGRGLLKAGVKRWTEAIDRYHLNERLGAALQLVETDAQLRARRMSEWNDDLDASDEAIERIQAWLGEQLDAVRGEENLDKYLAHLVYLENNQQRMQYRTLKDKGLPVGSGLTEGACKSVVGQRACGSGQRWRPGGLSAALTLRAIHRSERLPGSWKELSKSYTADIRQAA